MLKSTKMESIIGNTPSKTKKGFSLVELIVVVAIMGIMATAAFVRMGNTTDNNSVRGAGDIIKDTIQNAELQTLREEDGLSEIRIHFLEDYLVQEEFYGEKSPNMEIDEVCSGGVILKESGMIFKRTDKGELFDMTITSASESNPLSICSDFLNSIQREWMYHLENDENKRIIRFIHFNAERKGGGLRISIRDLEPDTFLSITPGIKKVMVVDGEPVTGKFTLTLNNKEGSVEKEVVLEF